MLTFPRENFCHSTLPRLKLCLSLHRLLLYPTLMNSLIDQDGKVYLYPDFLTKEAADNLYRLYLNDLAWSEEHIQIYGKSILVPRLVCWYGNQDAVYNYSGVKHTPLPWTASLTALKAQVETFTQHTFNSVLGNLYRNEEDSMGWHADDEKELGINPFIASVSLGAERIFKARHKTTKEQIKLILPHGSLLTMSGPFQQYWQHSIPKTSISKTPRINLTFRYIQH
ncbi:alpha-ketoglutarate-dependent dioxygenase AlkB family protein [Kaarinaea lacus]